MSDELKEAAEECAEALTECVPYGGDDATDPSDHFDFGKATKIIQRTMEGQAKQWREAYLEKHQLVLDGIKEIHNLNNKLCGEQLHRKRAEAFIKSCQGAPCTCTVDCDVALKHDKEQWCPTCAIDDYCKKLEKNDE